MAIKHTSEIKFNIGLDENKVPEEIKTILIDEDGFQLEQQTDHSGNE